MPSTESMTSEAPVAGSFLIHWPVGATGASDQRRGTFTHVAALLATILDLPVARLSDASANGRSLISAADYAAMRALLQQAPTDLSGGSGEPADDEIIPAGYRFINGSDPPPESGATHAEKTRKVLLGMD